MALLNRIAKTFMKVSQVGKRAYSTNFSEHFSWEEKLSTVVRNQCSKENSRIFTHRLIDTTCQSMAVASCMELGYQLRYGRRIQLITDALIIGGTKFGHAVKGGLMGFENGLDAAQYIMTRGCAGFAVDEPENVQRYYIEEIYFFTQQNHMPLYDSRILLSAIAMHPVLVGIQCTFKFYHYKRGFYGPEDGEYEYDEAGVAADIEDEAWDRARAEAEGTSYDVNYGHEMVAVGWKYHKGHLYIRIQNSWGERWGENGFAYVRFDCLDRDYLVILSVARGCPPLAGSANLDWGLRNGIARYEEGYFDSFCNRVNIKGHDICSNRFDICSNIFL